MAQTDTLYRFREAQQHAFEKALLEIKQGKKTSHWMWFIFPQIAGLGFSEMSVHYAMRNMDEAKRYLADPVLGPRLVDISRALLQVNGKTAHEIFGSPDDMKLRSCITLFASLENSHPVFGEVLDKYFEGRKDERTLSLISQKNNLS